jgi:hypothetical protein
VPASAGSGYSDIFQRKQQRIKGTVTAAAPPVESTPALSISGHSIGVQGTPRTTPAVSASADSSNGPGPAAFGRAINSQQALMADDDVHFRVFSQLNAHCVIQNLSGFYVSGRGLGSHFRSGAADAVGCRIRSQQQDALQCSVVCWYSVCTD